MAPKTYRSEIGAESTAPDRATDAPRIVIAGLSGDAGKTLVSLGLTLALRERGVDVAAFKKGPDYIDTAWLSWASGRPARNLDTWMLSDEDNNHVFACGCAEADVAVVEGMMGLFDGVAGGGEEGSSAEIAKMLDRVGVDMIVAGDPSVSPNVARAIERIASLGLRAEIVAHSIASRPSIDRAKACGANRVAVFYATSKIHLDSKLHKTEKQALEIIQEHVCYAKSLGLNVRYTPEDATRTFTYDVTKGKLQMTDRIDDGRNRLSNGIIYDSVITNRFSIVENQPASASVLCTRQIELSRGDWETRVETSSLMTSDRDYFHLTNILDAYEGQVRVFTKSWTKKIRRDLV